MTPEQAEAFAARTLTAIDARMGEPGRDNRAADRERVASDLDGLRDHVSNGGILTDECDRCYIHVDVEPCPDARRYADGLRRTAALYGVTDAQG